MQNGKHKVIKRRINWNGFLRKCVMDYPNEAIALIYTEKPYTDNEVWHIIPMKNIAKKPDNNFKIEDKESRELFKYSRDLGWHFIGSIHSHPYPKGKFSEEILQYKLLPSKKDLRSSKSRDLIVTAIIVCDNKAIYDIRFHNPFGIGKVDILLDTETTTVGNFFPEQESLMFFSRFAFVALLHHQNQ